MTITWTQLYCTPGDSYVQESVFVYSSIVRVLRNGVTYSQEDVDNVNELSDLGFKFTASTGRIDFKVPFATPEGVRPPRRDYEKVKVVYEIPS